MQISLPSANFSLLPGNDTLSDKKSRAGSPFRNALAEFVFTRTYPRWIAEEGRRERWDETVRRYVGFLREERSLIPADVLRDIESAILKMDVLPSMRALWSAGIAARRDNTMMYNCAFVPQDSLASFGELLYIMMMGTGNGFSVEREFVERLPVVAEGTGKWISFTIPDSTVGWKEAVDLQVQSAWRGVDVLFDYSLIRDEGAILKTKGGRASGPAPLRNLLNFIAWTVRGAAGRKLIDEEVSDICCVAGEIVMAGGVRRAAEIGFSSPDSERMRHYKQFPTCLVCGQVPHNHLTDEGKGGHLAEAHGMTEREYLKLYPGAYLGFPSLRFMANISSYWDEKPTREVFDKEWNALRNSGSGERGFFIIPAKKKQARQTSWLRSNPCGEILLKLALSLDPWTGKGGGGQFCNLSAAVMRAEDTKETMKEKVRVATWIGAIQATFTHFPHLREAWAKHCEEDRLLGVDITGHCDNPRLSNDPEVMLELNRVAVETAKIASKTLGINMPAAITCGKPSGNSSQVVDCASGFHPRYAAYYIRRVRIAAKDPLFQLIRDQGVPLVKDNKYTNVPDEECPTWVAEFPVKSPEGAMLRDHETALQQLERYRHIMNTWCNDYGHNQSATIYVRDNEWDAVGDWLYENWGQVTGLSFLPYDNGGYKLAPYEEITRERYEELAAAFPEVDYSLLPFYEDEDMGAGATELACMGGACEIDFSKDDLVEGDLSTEDEPTLERPHFSPHFDCDKSCGGVHNCDECLGRES